jgi:hypothetical protein
MFKVAIRTKGDINPGCVTRDGFVHGVVDDFSKKVVEGLFVRAADVHTRASANRLQAFQDFNISS